MSEFKPLFEMSNDLVLHNLHMGAAAEAYLACGGVDDIDKDIINSMDDGQHFIDKEGHSGEIGIIKKFTEFKNLDSLTDAKALKKVKSKIYLGLKAYLTYFVGEKIASHLKEDDLSLFVPEQNDKEMKIKTAGFSKKHLLDPMPKSDFLKFLANHPKETPRIGYKVSFELV